MKRCIILFLSLVGYASICWGQSTSTLHIVTVRGNLQWPMKFRFEVNGVPYTLSHGECMDISLDTDSIFLDVQDSRTFKYETYDLRTKASPDVNVWIYFGKNEGSSINHFYAKEDCECFPEIKKGCITTIYKP